MVCKMNGDVRLDIGPGETKRIWANSLKPGANVGVGLGRSSGASNVDVGAGVSVGSAACVNTAEVAKAACPVNATTVGRWSGGRGVGAGPVDWVQPANSPNREARRSKCRFIK